MIGDPRIPKSRKAKGEFFIQSAASLSFNLSPKTYQAFARVLKAERNCEPTGPFGQSVKITTVNFT